MPGPTDSQYHLVLLGDSILDNAAYVTDGLSVIAHLRKTIPDGCQATLLAVDGNVIGNIASQMKGLPPTASHLVISVGGNDVLKKLGMLSEPTSSVGDALLYLAGERDDFRQAYRRMLRIIQSCDLPFAVCTIYCDVPGLGAMEKVALALFNEVILLEAFSIKVPVIDLRLLCNEPGDYSTVSPIEPSHAGGQKIAEAIRSLIETHDFSLGRSTVISSIPSNDRIAAEIEDAPTTCAKVPDQDLLSISLVLPDKCIEPIKVIEIAPGRFRSRDSEAFPMMDNGVFWGDEFEATDLGMRQYQFERIVEPGRMVHLNWDLGFFLMPWSGNNRERDAQEIAALSLSLEETYQPTELEGYLATVGGALELNDFLQSVWVNIHLPAEHEQELLGALPRLCPQLKRESMKRLTSGFEQ